MCVLLLAVLTDTSQLTGLAVAGALSLGVTIAWAVQHFRGGAPDPKERTE